MLSKPIKDFNVYNLPAMLGRNVTRPDETDPTKWVRDETWYDTVRLKSYYLFRFFQDNGLLNRRVVDQLADVDAVVLRLSDFTEEGKAFVMSKAPHRWESSFDRLGSKKRLDDVDYLVKKLEEFRRLGSK